VIFAQPWRTTVRGVRMALSTFARNTTRQLAGSRGTPETFPKKYGAVRRAILKRAYYIVYFVVERERSLVLAVLDGRRRPDEIRSVVEERSRTRR
jgi:plasmid stabilization system protein ParE